MSQEKEILHKILKEGFLNYAGYALEEIDMKKLEKAPHKRSPMHCVSRKECQTQPMPDKKALLLYQRKFTMQEYHKLGFGLAPANKDEKWFVFMENEQLFFHRNITGECVYALHLQNESNRCYSIKEAWHNLHFQLEPGYAVALLDYLIDRLLLSKQVSFPFPQKMTDPIERVFFRYQMVGSSLANDEQ